MSKVPLIIQVAGFQTSHDNKVHPTLQEAQAAADEHCVTEFRAGIGGYEPTEWRELREALQSNPDAHVALTRILRDMTSTWPAPKGSRKPR